MPGNVTPARGKNRWRLRVPVGHDPVTGVYRQESKVVDATSKRAARAELAKFAAEVEQRPKLTKAKTVGEVLDEWLELTTHDGDHSPTTLRGYRSYIDHHIRPTLGAIPLHQLSPKPINDLYVSMTKSGLRPATVRQAHSIIRKALDLAVQYEWIPANPAASARKPKQQTPDIHPPTPDEIHTLISEAARSDGSLAVLLQVAAWTGARRGELCAIRWPNVDLERGTLTIGRALIHDQARTVEKDTKTHQVRRIALHAEAVNLLKAHRKIMEAKAIMGGVELSPDAYVWPAPYSLTGMQPWRPDQVTGAFRRLRNRLGLENVRLHDLRHAHATALLINGTDARTVAGRLGHKDPSTTLRVYAHWSPQADREAAEIAGSVFGPPALAP